MEPRTFELTPGIILSTIDEIRDSAPRYPFDLSGEMKNAVFETFVERLRLPLKRIEVGDIPDFDNPLVAKLHQELGEFEHLFG